MRFLLVALRARTGCYETVGKECRFETTVSRNRTSNEQKFWICKSITYTTKRASTSWLAVNVYRLCDWDSRVVALAIVLVFGIGAYGGCMYV